jgi:hypothetical protein
MRGASVAPLPNNLFGIALNYDPINFNVVITHLNNVKRHFFYDSKVYVAFAVCTDTLLLLSPR